MNPRIERIMLRFVLIIVLTFLVYSILNLLIKGCLFVRKKENNPAEPEELVQDPCCRTYIPKRTALRRKVAGKDYYFCDENCLHHYLQDRQPER